MKQELYKKLLNVKKLVPYIKKDKKGFNYTYATPTAVFGMLNPILNEAGILLITNVIDSKSYPITINTKSGPKTEWKYDVDFIFDWVDTETGEKISIPWKSSGVNGEDKGLGSALTYAERYFILKQFNIPTDDDDPDSFQEKHLTKEDKLERDKAAEYEKNTLVLNTVQSIKETKTMDELMYIWNSIGYIKSAKEVISAKNEKKVELSAKEVKQTDPAEIASAIGNLNLCTTKKELQDLKKALPAYIVADASFIDEAKKRYNVVMAQAATV